MTKKDKLDCILHQKMTDEEEYEMLKDIQNPDLMSAEEWKKRRLIELNKEGKKWTK